MVRHRCGSCIFYQNGICLLKNKPVRKNFFGCRFYSNGDIINILKRELNKEAYTDKLIKYSLLVFLLVFPAITNTDPISTVMGLLFSILGIFGINVRR